MGDLITSWWQWFLEGLHLPDWSNRAEVLDFLSRLAVGLAAVFIALMLFEMLLAVLRALHGLALRRRAAEALGVPLGRRYKVRRLKTPRDVGAFRLEFPRWARHNRDGRRDRRTNNYRVRVQPSVVEVYDWRITLSDPLELYRLVNELRDAGHDVGPNDMEVAKARQYNAAVARNGVAADIDSLIERFSSVPNQFEEFCAQLFRAQGCQAQATAATRDGGVDIRMEMGGVRTIVECKCYQRSNIVGRPVIQKLRGANEVEGAQRALVVTTSSFSREAITYAQQAGVELMDGSVLMAMCRHVWGARPPASLLPVQAVRLSAGDLRANYPPDMH